MSKTLISLNQLENSNVGNKTIVTNVFGVPVYIDYNLPFLPLSGGTVTGATSFTGGLTANTISATTYYNLPKDVFITGGTYFQGNTIFTNSTGDTFNIFGPSNYDPGVISGNTIWTSNGNGSMNLPQITVALFDNPNFFEPLKFYSILSGTTGVGSIPALINNDTNYIIIEYNNGVPRYNVLDNDGTVDFSSVILYMIVYRADNFVHVLEFGNTGSGLPSKLNERLVYTNRFARESGCGLGLSGSTGVVTLSSGVVWNGTDREVINDTTSLGIFFRNFQSGGTWVYTTTAHTINNLYYDDGTNLISATAGKYLVNWYFRGQELNDHLYEVVSNGQFDNILLADASSEPSLPELITSHAFLVGRIIIEVSATTGITQSAFSSVFQPSGAPGVHNDLTNIQGGLPNQYYHLDSNKYNNLALTNIDNNFSAGQTFASGLTANTISATTYQNLPPTPFLPLSGGTVTGATNFTGGLTATTISAGTISTSLTGGSVLFSNGSTIAQDNANFFWDDTNNRLGIGTASPLYPLDVNTGRVRIAGNNGIVGAIAGSNYGLSVQDNSPASWIEILNNGGVNKGAFFGISSNNFEMWNYQGGPIDFYTDVTATSGLNRLRINNNGNVLIGTTTDAGFKLEVNGTTRLNGGLTANTISATTYQNLPSTPFLPLSGGTVTGETIFTGGLTANTISATTYQNLPATPFLPLSGGTVTGETIFTGGLTANTISATTYQNLPPSLVKSINSVSGNTNAGSNQSTDYIYFASNTITITLPTAISNTNSYVIKNVGTGTITINTTSSQTIDGSLTAPIRVQYLSLTIISDGANWNII